ncbi:CLUMA_CG015579, isoform A [Clunio marinus]|uniref:Odorant receptor n=1 Tax=Clunio marinus TaxID=568069 RepID=A0A1J1IRA5_9DIPT|nr:CLUMA_CG015579, isoform A [Clunio marinus]
MEKYFEFNRKTLINLGFAFDRDEKKFEKFLKVFTLLTVCLMIFQSFVEIGVQSKSKITISTISTISVVLYNIQGLAKFMAILINQRKLCDIKRRLSDFIKVQDENQMKARQLQIQRFPWVIKFMYIINIGCVWLFTILATFALIYTVITHGNFSKNSIFRRWYPFDEIKYFIPIFIYERITNHFLTSIHTNLDGFILLLLGQFCILFQNHGEYFENILNNSMEISNFDNKLKAAIDYHNELLELSDKLVTIYEIPLFVNVLNQTSTICFIAFIISTFPLDIAIASFIGLVSSIAQIFILCWFGDKIKDNSLEIGDKILNSKYQNLNKSQKKSLLLIVMRSQNARYLRGSKFFNLELSGFTSVKN